MSFISCSRVLLCVHLLVVLFLISCYYAGAMFPFPPVALFLPQLLWWHQHMSCIFYSFSLDSFRCSVLSFTSTTSSIDDPLFLDLGVFLQIYGFYWVHFLLRRLQGTLRLAASGMWCERRIHSWVGFWTGSTCLRKPQASRRLRHRPWHIVSDVVIISFYTPQQKPDALSPISPFPRRWQMQCRRSQICLRPSLWRGLRWLRLNCLAAPLGLEAAGWALRQSLLFEQRWIALKLTLGFCSWRPQADSFITSQRLVQITWSRCSLICLVQSPSRKPLTLKYHTESTTCMSACRHSFPPPVICCFFRLDVRWEDYFNFASSSENKCVSFEFLICETKAGNLCLSAHPVANSFYCFHLYLLPLLEGFYCGHQGSRF